MAIDFPTSPTVGQQYSYQGTTYVFSAQGVWVQVSGGSSTIGLNVIQRIFTSSISYVPNAGLLVAIVEVVASGGGGGGVAGTAAQFYGGGGGGSGGYSRRRLTSAEIGASVAITIGTPGTGGAAAGGGDAADGADCSFGALVVAKGGKGGKGNSTAGGVGAFLGLGGAGGSVTGAVGDLVAAGSPGISGVYSNGASLVDLTGQGGSSFFGGGAAAVTAVGAAVAGNPASNYGSGGGGAFAHSTAATAAGGAGSAGVCVVTEFIVASTGGGGGGVSTDFAAPQGRLTLQTLTPVMATTQAGKTTIFYTPYAGNWIPLYNGTTFVQTLFTELSVLTTDATKSPAAIGASKVNDWFVWSDAGTLRIGHGPDWTNDTTRSAGTALQMINGIMTNAVAITNGPPINRGTYVGTTRSNASSQLDWIYGTLAVSGGAALLNVWNMYNRVEISTVVQESTSNWTTASGVMRPLNAGAVGGGLGNRASAVFGLAEEPTRAEVICTGRAPTGHLMIGVGFDSTASPTGNYGSNGLATINTPLVGVDIRTALGYHFWQVIEGCTDTSGVVFGNLVIGAVNVNSEGLYFTARM